MSEEKRKIIVVGDPSIGHKFADAIDNDGEIYDIKTTSTGTSIEDLVMMKNNETEQLINELIRTTNERIMTNSLNKPLSGQESRRERRKQQRNLWK
jgi:hypothetical protein